MQLYRQVNGVTLYQGDARKLNALEDESICMVITSPPFNVGIEYDVWNDSMPAAEYWQFFEDWLCEAYRVLRVGGRIAINVPNIANSKDGGKSPGLVPMSMPVWNLLVKVGFMPREQIAWIKTHDTQLADSNPSFCGNATAWGSWQSPSNPFCRSFLEFVLVAHKQSPALTWQGKSDLTKEEFLRDTKNFWLLPAETNRDHPAPFPLELPTRLMKLYTYIGDTVLDPFVGSGTTVRAATDNGRIGIGVDVSEMYLEYAAFRCAQLRLVHCQET